MATQIHAFGPNGELSPGAAAALEGLGGGVGSGVTATDAPTVPAEGASASYLVTSAVTWPDGLVWSTDPDGDEEPTITEAALVSFFTLGGTTYAVMGATFPTVVIPDPEDETPPTPGTLAASSITDTGFTLTVTGASDETALHSQPYAFSTDNGATWSAWQAGATFNVTELDPETEYTCKHKVRDAALNEATGASITVETEGPVTPLTITHTGATGALATPTSPHTWASAPIGTATPTRRVVVTTHAYKPSPFEITSMTIGGISASRMHRVMTGADRIFLEYWSAVVPTGAAADIVLEMNSSPSILRVAAHVVDGGASQVGSLGTSLSVAVPAGGVVLAAAACYENGSTTVPTWSGEVTPSWVGNTGNVTAGSTAIATAASADTIDFSVAWSASTSFEGATSLSIGPA